LYTKYNVKRGLRDENGKGVLQAYEYSEINSRKIINGEEVPCPENYFTGVIISKIS
jgi:hypothetical protein